jgi:DNA mismatch repair protein MutL
VPLWQLHRRYLFAQTRQGLLIIDQHAAHERVLYEQALATLRGAGATTQQLLFPQVIQLDPEEEAAWSEFAGDMPRLGIDGEEFGRQTLLLRGVPVLWTHDPEGRLRELLSELGSHKMRGEGREERLAAAFACRSAIRAGQTLTLEEMNALVDRLFAAEVPHGDPHGRPTFLQVTLEDLDRRFGRSG